MLSNLLDKRYAIRRTARSVVVALQSRLVSASSKPHIVVALGGNALLKRNEQMTMDNQRRNIEEGMKSFKGLLDEHTVTIVHGNGPQVGLLFLETTSYKKETGLEAIKLDVLDAETEGMIGYLLEQAMQKYISPTRGMATVLSQIIVDPSDPAFDNPSKFVGPVFSKEEADKLDGTFKQDGDSYRRVVPSPPPIRMLPSQLQAVKCLTKQDCVVICAGGGGIPVVQEKDGTIRGVEAVIDKDRAACMMALDLDATGLLILTDVSAVAIDYKTKDERWIKSVSPEKLLSLMSHFPSGSMGPKVDAVCEFAAKSGGGGGYGAIGSLNDADKILRRDAGTHVRNDLGEDHIEFY
ncbi:hypothetical protein MPSEU_001036200 [Mayamaea pseudoterrestris]|nr:hypothetical protein MPSEU_001036200 [Mayamaea pseudoterrestris]